MVSPDLKVRSITRPVLRLRILTRLNACPLPGLTNSFSTMLAGSPSSITLSPDLNSFVLYVAMKHLPIKIEILTDFPSPLAGEGKGRGGVGACAYAHALPSPSLPPDR